MMGRRKFAKTTAAAAGAALAAGALTHSERALAADPPGSQMHLGLVTYNWAKDWDLDTILKYLTESKVLAVELRTTHKHGVELSLTTAQRQEVKKRFADSPVKLLGPGSAECFDHVDPAKLAKAIEDTKAFLKLSSDLGASGVKVRPNDFHKEVAHEKTIEQIGKSLNIVGKFAGELGQQIRVEIHGQCCELPTIKQIIDIADDPHVALCWNSNPNDLKGEGLEHNFNLVKPRLGATTHVRELDSPGYPWDKLIALFVGMDYKGWLLLECTSKIDDPVAALTHQREVFEKLVAQARH
ncbi:MAG: TIM barrel protein [Planctomycetota bacterium]